MISKITKTLANYLLFPNFSASDCQIFYWFRYYEVKPVNEMAWKEKVKDTCGRATGYLLEYTHCIETRNQDLSLIKLV